MEDGISLLDALREELGCRSVKDGCSPQGQCGCCTVWVDGAPRVACVTPVRRIAGRAVTTLEGAPEELRDRWAAAFVQHGASQCGFCTPGIVLRLAALEARRGRRRPTRRDIESALRAHLCRCTGWQSIVEAACSALGVDGAARRRRDRTIPATRCSPPGGPRSRDRPSRASGSDVVLGGGGFADDTAPPDALVQLGADGAVAPNLRAARAGERARAGPQQHRAAVPPGRVARGRLGADAADVVGRAGLRRAGRQLVPGPATRRPRRWPTAAPSVASATARSRRRPRRWPKRAGDAVRVLWRREDVVRRGPKRPPLAVGLRPDGTGVVRVGRTERLGRPRTHVAGQLRACRPARGGRAGRRRRTAGVAFDLRGAGWAEVLAARAALDARRRRRRAVGEVHVAVPGAGSARVAAAPRRRGRGAGPRSTSGPARSSVR